MTQVKHMIDLHGGGIMVYLNNGTRVLAKPTFNDLWIIGAVDDDIPPTAAFIAPFNFDFATSEYGWRTDPFGSGKQVFHSGIDGSTAAGVGNGAPVIASGDGVVKIAGWNVWGNWGNSIIIDHGSGLWTGYAHMQDGSMTVETGDSVSQGDTLGLVGNTGASTGPHLHFSTFVNGQTVNPRNFLMTYGS
jgi:murein DD-endopeptidase MepM/ murein hydrolase activator NlpD